MRGMGVKDVVMVAKLSASPYPIVQSLSVGALQEVDGVGGGGKKLSINVVDSGGMHELCKCVMQSIKVDKLYKNFFVAKITKLMYNVHLLTQQ